ncbi:MAG: putative lipoprotein YmbA [Gammaproteobacteria bacterium]|jgi:uncharacterized lipoprotein YmbA
MDAPFHVAIAPSGVSRMPMRMLSQALLTILLPILLLGGCTTGPPPNLYMLDLPFTAQMAGLEKGLAVGIGPLELPQYLDRPQIITRAGVNRLQAAEAHIWAEPIKDSALRVLVVTIARALDSNRIYLLPRRVRTTLDWRVAIDVGRFDGAIGGDVLLAARWSLYRGDEKDVSLTRVSIVEEAVVGPDYEALVTAQTRAVARLGEEIAAAIQSGGS